MLINKNTLFFKILANIFNLCVLEANELQIPKKINKAKYAVYKNLFPSLNLIK